MPASVDRSCIDSALRLEGLHSIQRLLYSIGAFQVTKAEHGGGEAKFYTLFRIPLDTIRTICDYAAIEYSSDQLGISFNYPTGYVLFERKGDAVGAMESYFIGLTPHQSSTSELPPSTQVDLEPSPGILFGFYREADRVDSFDEWVREQMIYRASPDNIQDPILHPITVGGVPAVRYLDASGLYQRDTVLLKHGTWMVQVSADDAAYFKADLDSILSSITFH
ncbi:MAG: hypothetical protein A2494_01495 [Candidatus Lloydbacteria bacterium RIFOXYC12_FULL_46_25]|uniref:Uncharacterized protein n=1 Tax=Candidatus Lloydbacteria bacterium RIFOXYC12_FULL_46_25 TaxID=1798670 RepID=A0A1G2DV39_9BACT|nr:MAG: hypothetical protein A2494_01495 [Candidatus Lloydbacteria bacterium RIFOXYC12_FULL_46_25]